MSQLGDYIRKEEQRRVQAESKRKIQKRDFELAVEMLFNQIENWLRSDRDARALKIENGEVIEFDDYEQRESMEIQTSIATIRLQSHFKPDFANVIGAVSVESDNGKFTLLHDAPNTWRISWADNLNKPEHSAELTETGFLESLINLLDRSK